MNDHELNRRLLGVPVPERDEASWRDFSETVARRIRQEKLPDAPVSRAPDSATGIPRWAWGLALAGLGLVLLLAIARGTRSPGLSPDSSAQLASLRTCYRQVADLFPGRLEAVILSAKDAKLQLSETADVPASPPLFVRICSPADSCLTAVSFSGQKIQVAGREFEILASGAGEIFMLAKEEVWAPGHVPVGGESWRLEAGWLGRSL